MVTLFCFTETFGFSTDQLRMVATLLIFILFLFILNNFSYIFLIPQTLYLYLHLYLYHVSNHILDMSIFLHLNLLLLHFYNHIYYSIDYSDNIYLSQLLFYLTNLIYIKTRMNSLIGMFFKCFAILWT